MKSRIAVAAASLAALSFAALPVAQAAAATTHHDRSPDRSKVEQTYRDHSRDANSRDTYSTSRDVRDH